MNTQPRPNFISEEIAKSQQMIQDISSIYATDAHRTARIQEALDDLEHARIIIENLI